ncbi:hypothetical protein HY624_02370 [Candidatus Uhrbacteria bacterium]|nr:hypothetical protein [Candidatus Uhrbacteria bacterium]
MLWQKSFGQGAYNWMTGIDKGVDQKGLVFLGMTTPSKPNPKLPDILWIFEVDEKGNFVWQKGYATSLNMSVTHFAPFSNSYQIGSGSRFFTASAKGDIKNPPPKLLKPVKARFPSKKFIQEGIATDIHDYEILLETDEAKAKTKQILMGTNE